MVVVHSEKNTRLGVAEKRGENLPYQGIMKKCFYAKENMFSNK